MSDTEDIEAAFDVLGLSPDATAEEVKERYHSLSRRHHPDLGTEDHSEQTKLNLAYDIALATADSRNTLPALVADTLGDLTQRIEADSAGRKAAAAVELAKRRHLGRLGGYKYFTLVLSGVSGLAALLSDSLFADISALALQFGAIALLLGAVGAVLHLVVEHIEHTIDAFAVDLEDLVHCAEQLALVLDYRDTDEVSESQVAAPPSGRSEPLLWFLDHRGLTSSERARILVLKATEHGLLVPQPLAHLAPGVSRDYTVAFKPSRFDPGPPPPPPPPPSATSLKRGAMGCATAIATMMGGGGALYFLVDSRLYIVPAVLAGLGALTLPEFIRLWRQAVAREAVGDGDDGGELRDGCADP